MSSLSRAPRGAVSLNNVRRRQRAPTRANAAQRVPNVGAQGADTPYLRHRYRHDRLSVCSGLAMSPTRRRLALYLRCRPRNLTGLDIRAFLHHLLRHLRGPVDLLWDRGPIHRRREVQAFLAGHPRARTQSRGVCLGPGRPGARQRSAG